MSVALFVTCLVDQLFPEIGEAAVRLLREAGSEVAFPEDQTCCGQPFHSAGRRREARRLARRLLDTFEPHATVVTPSGSCAALIRRHLPEICAGTADADRARALAARTHELAVYLRSRGWRPRRPFEGRVACHVSCHALRETGAAPALSELLAGVPELEPVPISDATECCGFGGAFCVEYAELSAGMLRDKIRALEQSGADVVAATDPGCMMHLRGGLARLGSRLPVVHYAEILAGGR